MEAGTLLVMVTLVDWPGASVTEEEENVVVQPWGSVDEMAKVREPHAAESLFFRLTV